MIRIRSFQIYSFFLFLFASVGCGDKKRTNVSNIDLNIKIERFDQDFRKLEKGRLYSGTIDLQKKYGVFYKDYMQRIISLGTTDDTLYFNSVRTILNNKDYQELQKEVNVLFSDMSPTEVNLSEAFRLLKYHFPQIKAPRVVSFVSGFAVQVSVGENYMGIGLDMFLGADSKFYPALRQSIPEYISRRFTPENITPRVTEAFIRENLFPENNKSATLLDRMIYNGKVMYLLKEALPDEQDSVIFGYTTKQLDWCKQYEGDVWAFFLNENLVYETDYMKIQKYLTDAPFTPGVGEGNNSSPKLAVFTGGQIVKKYMEQNPDINLPELMKEKDSRKILADSKYKPK